MTLTQCVLLPDSAMALYFTCITQNCSVVDENAFTKNRENREPLSKKCIYRIFFFFFVFFMNVKKILSLNIAVLCVGSRQMQLQLHVELYAFHTLVFFFSNNEGSRSFSSSKCNIFQHKCITLMSQRSMASCIMIFMFPEAKIYWASSLATIYE